MCDTGGSVTWTSVAKPFEGGAESYVPAEGSMDVHVAEPGGELTAADGPRPARPSSPRPGSPVGGCSVRWALGVGGLAVGAAAGYAVASETDSARWWLQGRRT